MAEVLARVRRAKTEAKVSMRAPVEKVVVRDTPERLAALDRGRADLLEAGSISELVTEPGDQLDVEVTLAPVEQPSA